MEFPIIKGDKVIIMFSNGERLENCEIVQFDSENPFVFVKDLDSNETVALNCFNHTFESIRRKDK